MLLIPWALAEDPSPPAAPPPEAPPPEAPAPEAPAGDTAAPPERPKRVAGPALAKGGLGRLYVGSPAPIDGLGFYGDGTPILYLNALPLTAEYAFARQWGVRLATSVPYAWSPIGRAFGTPSIRVETPFYYGNGARQHPVKGSFIGPYTGIDTQGVPEFGGILGTSNFIGESDLFRWRSAVWLGVTPQFQINYGFTIFEFGVMVW